MTHLRVLGLMFAFSLGACGSDSPPEAATEHPMGPSVDPSQATGEEPPRELLQERYHLDPAELDLWQGSRLAFRRSLREGAAADQLDALALEYARFSIQVQLREQGRVRSAEVDGQGRVQLESDLARQGEFMWVMNTEVFIVPQGEFPALDILEHRRATRAAGGDPGPFPQALIDAVEALDDELPLDQFAPSDDGRPTEGN